MGKLVYKKTVNRNEEVEALYPVLRESYVALIIHVHVTTIAYSVNLSALDSEFRKKVW